MEYIPITLVHYPKSDNKYQETDFFDLPDGIMNNTAKELLHRIVLERNQFQLQEDQS